MDLYKARVHYCTSWLAALVQGSLQSILQKDKALVRYCTKRLCKSGLMVRSCRATISPSTGFTHPLNSGSLYGFVCGKLKFAHPYHPLQNQNFSPLLGRPPFNPHKQGNPGSALLKESLPGFLYSKARCSAPFPIGGRGLRSVGSAQISFQQLAARSLP